MESLRGPALEVVKGLRLSEPEESAEEYLEALDSAFLSAESDEDHYFSFHLIHQKANEKLSDFVQRLEPILTKVVKKGSISVRDKDRVRVEKLLRGAVDLDPMLLQLQLRERRRDLPNVLDLLSEIKQEEVHERTRHEANARVCKLVVGGESAETERDPIEDLRDDLT